MTHIVQNAENYSVHLEDQVCPELLDGEVLYLRFFRVIFLDNINVTLWITNYRIFYTNQTTSITSFIPLMSIMDIKRNNDKCILTTKYFANIPLQFENSSTTDRFIHHLLPMIHTKKYLDIFAFHYKSEKASSDNLIDGWDIFELEKEFERQKAFNKGNSDSQLMWTITMMNWNYNIPSYPSSFIVHQQIKDKEIKKINTRLRMRFPILMWYNKYNNGSGVLLRADEPDLSILDFKESEINTKVSDINLLKKLGSESKSIHIIDVHTKKTYALLYSQFNVHFLEFESNEVIIKKLKQLHINNSIRISNQNIFTEWIDLLRRVLLNSAKIAILLKEGHCINLNHNMKCDIDYILSSISQLLIDGYYRTLIGIQVLIEKDWCYYGYEFASKISHGSSPEDYEDRSIAFELFLECIWILLNQFPLHFEFNEYFLETIAESLYSCLYGTFLGNCEKDRKILKEKTISLWTEINSNADNYRNAFYDSDTYDLLLIPRLDQSSIKVWTTFHFKYESKNTNAYIEICKSKDQSCLDLSNIGFSGLLYDKIDIMALTHLDLSKNLLHYFPMCILNFYNLKHLNISSNPIKNISSDIAYIMGIHLTKLKELNISNTDIQKIPKELGMLQSLKVLKCSNNTIEKIPKSLSSLKCLEVLDLRYNHIKSIPNIFNDMINLKLITISSNQVENIKNSKFTDNLLVFDAINNNIPEFPEAISKSRSLQYLLLDLNNIESIPNMIGNFQNLLVLSVSRSQVQIISEEISQLINLRTLSLYDNKLNTLPSQISLLTNLETLDLNTNQFKEIPEPVLYLKNLEILNFSFNKINSIPSLLSFQLTRLKQLHLETNPIQTLDNIPGLWKLSDLQCLNILDTNVTSIPSSFGLLSNLKELKVDENRLLFPPNEVIKKDAKFTLKYLSDQFFSFYEPNHVDIIVLGENRSDLIKSISTKHIEKMSISNTISIDYYQWSFELNHDKNKQISSINSRLLEINLGDKSNSISSIYNLFISSSRICMIVWHLNNPIESLFPLIEMIQAAPSKVDVVIACIFTDDNPNITKNDLEAIGKKYRKRYPVIKKLVGLSSPKKCDRELKNAFSSVKTEWYFTKNIYKAKYETFEKFIEHESRSTPIISWEKYVEMASHCCIEDEEDLQTVTQYLIDRGLIYYNKNNSILSEHVFINTIIAMRFIELLKEYTNPVDGIFVHDRIHDVNLKQFPSFLCTYLINLLEDLKILYKFEDYMKRYNIQSSLIPIFLQNDKPSSVYERWKESEGNYQFGRIYEMKSIPFDLITLTQLRVRGLLECVTLWKNGFFVDYKESNEMVLLEVDPKQNQIVINVRIKDNCYISRTIIEIFDCVRKMKKANGKVFVPCFSHTDQESGKPIRFTLEACEKAIILSNNLLTNDKIEIEVDKIVPDLSLKNLGLNIIAWSDLKIERKIAEGGSAEIFIADYKGKKVAVKQLRATSEEKNNMMMPVANNTLSSAFTDFRREVRYISKLNHSTILEFEGLVLKPLSIVIEYCSGGDLFNFIHNSRGECDWDLRLKVAYDISRGMAIMHSHNPPIIHRDLKSPNIMIVHNDEDYKETDAIVKIADFGLSGILPEVGGREVDNPVWLAPEVMTRSNYSEKSDVYSFGVILYELLMSKEFFAEVSFMSDIESLVIEGKRPEIPKDRHDLYKIPEFINLMMECWHNNEKNRPSFKEIHIKLVEMMEKHAPYLKPTKIENFDQYLVKHEEF